MLKLTPIGRLLGAVLLGFAAFVTIFDSFEWFGVSLGLWEPNPNQITDDISGLCLWVGILLAREAWKMTEPFRIRSENDNPVSQLADEASR